jgi:dynein heavy chain
MDYEEELQIEAKTATIVEMCKNIHKSVEKISEGFLTELRRHNYVTPTSYLELLTMFRQIMQLKKKEVENSIKRLQSGLNKLIEANTQVEEMRIVLKDMQPELEKAS